MSENPEGQRLYTEAEIQEILARSGVRPPKTLVTVTVIGVYDNGENFVQSAHNPIGLQVSVSPVAPPEVEEPGSGD